MSLSWSSTTKPRRHNPGLIDRLTGFTDGPLLTGLTDQTPFNHRRNLAPDARMSKDDLPEIVHAEDYSYWRIKTRERAAEAMVYANKVVAQKLIKRIETGYGTVNPSLNAEQLAKHEDTIADIYRINILLRGGNPSPDQLSANAPRTQETPQAIGEILLSPRRAVGGFDSSLRHVDVPVTTLTDPDITFVQNNIHIAAEGLQARKTALEGTGDRLPSEEEIILFNLELLRNQYMSEQSFAQEQQHLHTL
jgi:hypothetical protein